MHMSADAAAMESAREAVARERLEELQVLARTYRSWSVKELAHALGRQPGRLVPDSGMPKIDLVVALARALDWTVEAVVEHLMSAASHGVPRLLEASTRDHAALLAASHFQRESGDHVEAVRLAVLARQAATSVAGRVEAVVAEAAAHELAGAYHDASRALRDSVPCTGIPLEVRLCCDARLAALLSLQDERAMAIGLGAAVLQAASGVPQCPHQRVARALAHAARVHAFRISMPLEGLETWRLVAEQARLECAAAEALVATLAREPGAVATGGIAFTRLLEPAGHELDAIVDPRRAEAAMAALVAIVVGKRSREVPPGDREAWAAIALARTAERFLPEGTELRGALEIASSTLRACAVGRSHWHFAYHHFEIDRGRRRMLPGHLAPNRALDAVEAKLLAGVLGQIPTARSNAREYFELYGPIVKRPHRPSRGRKKPAK